MKKLSLIILTFCVSFSIFAQSGAQKQIAELEKLKGTYQVQIRGQLRESVFLPIDLADIILQKRDDSKVVYYYILENKVRVKILPKSQILSPNFKPLGVQTIVNEFSND